MTPKTVKEGVREFNKAIGNPFSEENPGRTEETLKFLKDWSRAAWDNPLLHGPYWSAEPYIFPGQRWTCGQLEGEMKSYANGLESSEAYKLF